MKIVALGSNVAIICILALGLSSQGLAQIEISDPDAPPINLDDVRDPDVALLDDASLGPTFNPWRMSLTRHPTEPRLNGLGLIVHTAIQNQTGSVVDNLSSPKQTRLSLAAAQNKEKPT